MNALRDTLIQHGVPPEIGDAPKDHLPPHSRPPRTQKAKGRRVLSQGTTTQIAQTLAEAIAAFLYLQKLGWTVFCRPCPKWPRPGFWDSRVCTTVPELIELWNGMMTVEPEAEMILMPFQESNFSACWTPGLVALGPGNDGATAGLSSFAVPLCEWNRNADSEENLSLQVKDSGVDDADEDRRFPHIELVFPKGTNSVSLTHYTETPGQLVQIRAGHKAAGAGDWIPKSVTVREIKDAPVGNAVDLMTEFEEWAADNAGRDGLVVYAPGSSQGSHTALHCKANGIAFICEGDRPVIGNTFPATTTLRPINAKACAKSFAAGLSVKLNNHRDYKDAVRLMLILTHGYQPDGDHAKWVGAAAALMLRLGTAAGLGEFRYYRGHAVTKPNLVSSAGCRDDVYEKAFNAYFQSRKMLDDAFTAYGDPAPNAWTGGYGGKAWFNCIQATLQLEAAVVDMLRAQTPESVNHLATKINNCVNQAHNGGWFLSKYASDTEQDKAADGSFSQLRNTFPLLWRLHRTEKEMSFQKVTAIINRSFKIVEHDLLWVEPPKPKGEAAAGEWKNELNDYLFAKHYQTSEPETHRNSVLDHRTLRWRVVEGPTVRVQVRFAKYPNRYIEFDRKLGQAAFQRLIATARPEQDCKSWSSEARYYLAESVEGEVKQNMRLNEAATIKVPQGSKIFNYNGSDK